MKIAVALSGGVDSSVSLLLLKEAGHDVVAIFMKNWDDDDDPNCPAAQDYEDALMVCQKLNVPLYAFDFCESYWNNVFSSFIEDLKKGYTPNPDILCNREIKFKVLLEKARELNANYLATGHYAKVQGGGARGDLSTSEPTEGPQLLRGVDRNKDQTYFLYAIERDVLNEVIFPIGHLQKSVVRDLAKEHGLITANKRDSTGICFIGKRKFSDFIAKYMPPTKGVFKTLDGKVVGEHNGAWFYTIGQRKGLGIGGPGDAWFVSGKDISTHDVFVVQGEDHPALLKDVIYAHDLNWLVDDPLLHKNTCRCSAKIRYRTEDQPCEIEVLDKGVCKIKFDDPVRAPTERQSVVFYQDQICLGGGLIALEKKSLLVE